MSPIQYEFKIIGNQDDPLGNPIPKLKMTGRQHWTKQAKRYVDWKMFVTRCFLDIHNVVPVPVSYIKDFRIVDLEVDTKPITIPPGRKAYMEIMIRWKNNKRPDAENVFGSIADALFENDKYLAGSFDFAWEPTGQGMVEVRIKI